MRDGYALSRPTRWAAGLDSFEYNEDPPKIASWKLLPGAANQGEHMTVTLMHLGEADGWIHVRALIAVDEIVWQGSRPGTIFADDGKVWPYGQWSCVVNFPHLADAGPRIGVMSLLLRTIVEPKRTM